MNLKKRIPVIDLFAGPGGLGEGFSSFLINEQNVFNLKLSIEKDPDAHRTLKLRSFFRQFPKRDIPQDYYRLLQESDLKQRKRRLCELYEKFPNEAALADREAFLAELGNDEFPPEIIDSKIINELSNEKDWVLIGGPPCQAFSVVGRSRRQWKENLDIEDKRVHLYKEYLRIIAVHHPAVFVMENVKGLLSSNVDGEPMFDLIQRDLSNPGSVFAGNNSPDYKIFSLTHSPSCYEEESPIFSKNTDFLIKAEQYGIPQKRHRVILLGIRDDIGIIPDTLTKNENSYTIADVIGDLPKIRSGLNRRFIGYKEKNGKQKRVYEKIDNNDSTWENEISKFKSDILTNSVFSNKLNISKIKAPTFGIGSEYIQCISPAKTNPLYSWYRDSNLGGVCNHQSRTHLIQDIQRYLFAAIFSKEYKRFPRINDFKLFADELLPDHKNVESGKFADRFRVQVRDTPATTITSHISKDGHYFIHYDINQCRSLTVREAARIQTFPDNYLFCGSRTAQYHQVGNAVPPFLANQIAKIVFKILQNKNGESI